MQESLFIFDCGCSLTVSHKVNTERESTEQRKDTEVREVI